MARVVFSFSPSYSRSSVTIFLLQLKIYACSEILQHRILLCKQNFSTHENCKSQEKYNKTSQNRSSSVVKNDTHSEFFKKISEIERFSGIVGFRNANQELSVSEIVCFRNCLFQKL